ncbi:MAG TPA: hypothetical protein PLZ01_14905, partial [bacterium]|nr:hypothetical protein [bacterium]
MMEPLSFERAKGLALHAPFWRQEEVEALMADRPQLALYQTELLVSQRRALEWHNALYRDQSRRGEVVLCLQNSAGQYLMHSKSFYPSNVYRLLTGEQGLRLRSIAAADSQSHRTARAIDWIKNNFDQPLSIDALAEAANM